MESSAIKKTMETTLRSVRYYGMQQWKCGVQSRTIQVQVQLLLQCVLCVCWVEFINKATTTTTTLRNAVCISIGIPNEIPII